MMKRLSRFSGFIVVSVAILLASAGLHAQQAGTTLEGILHIVWGDPHPTLGSGGATLYSLALSDGTTIPLQMTGQDSVAAYYFGKRVSVSGRVVPNQFATTNSQNPSALVVDTIAPVAGTITPGQTPQDQTPSASVLGTRKVIYLLVKFSDDVAVPHPPVFYTDLLNPDTPPAGELFPATVNGFFKKTSWNQFSWVGFVGGMGGVGAPGGWLTLPGTKSHYANCGGNSSCASLTLLGDDATALGRAQGINFTTYDNINFVLSNDLDCCAWGGSYYSTVDGKTYGATWEPPWGQEAGTYSHEMGHSIGLPHSGWVYYAYDSPWDIMSDRTAANTVACGSYISKNAFGNTVYCDEPGDGYIAAHKDFLGWIPLVNEVVTSTSSTGTWTIEADALPLGSFAKIIKICITGLPCTGATAHYFTVEARVKGLGTTSQFDNGIPGEGIIIHEFLGNRAPISGACYFNSQSGWAVPIDSTPGDYDSVACNAGGRSYPNYALFNAQWLPGQTYTNGTYGLSIAVVSRAGSTFVVSINGGTSYMLTVTKSGTGSGTVTSTPTGINCGVTCSASFAGGTPVSLAAAPAAGSIFTGWSGGACAGTGTCPVTMNSALSVTATFTPDHAPGAPTGVTTTPGPGKATINFTAPADHGGSAITGYTATCVAAGQPTKTASGTSSPITVSGLVGGVVYSCSVAASNGAGTGASSVSVPVQVLPNRGIAPILLLLLE
jgi:M6 family metalloprotease-like protein